MDIEKERKSFTEIGCIICDKSIQMLDPGVKTVKNKDPKEYMWKDGLVDMVSAGYGSKNDGDLYYLGICDDCIAKKLKDGSLFYNGSYIFNELNNVVTKNDDYRRTKQRNSNIDNLLDNNDEE